MKLLPTIFLVGTYSSLYVTFALKRHMGYFLINVYVPCSMLVILSWVAFWINREATADRIALGKSPVYVKSKAAQRSAAFFNCSNASQWYRAHRRSAVRRIFAATLAAKIAHRTICAAGCRVGGCREAARQWSGLIPESVHHDS